MCMEMEILLVFIPGILSKKCYTSATLVFERESYSSDSKFDYNQFQQVDIFIGVSSYPEGGIMGRIRMKKSKSYFHPKILYMQDSTQLEVIFSIRSSGGKYYIELGSIISGSYF